MIHSKALTWSVIQPKPIVFVDSKTGYRLVAWNNFLTSFNVALLVAGANFFSVFPTPEMKRQAHQNFIKLYAAGAFGTVTWDRVLSQTSCIYHYTNHKLNKHISQNLANIDPVEAWNWFYLDAPLTDQ